MLQIGRSCLLSDNALDCRLPCLSGLTLRPSSEQVPSVFSFRSYEQSFPTLIGPPSTPHKCPTIVAMGGPSFGRRVSPIWSSLPQIGCLIDGSLAESSHHPACVQPVAVKMIHNGIQYMHSHTSRRLAMSTHTDASTRQNEFLGGWRRRALCLLIVFILVLLLLPGQLVRCLDPANQESNSPNRL